MSTSSSRLSDVLRTDPTVWVSDVSKDWLWKAFMAFWILFILAPPIMLVFISLDTASYVRIPQGITLAKYELMLQSDALITAMERSLKLAVVTMFVAPALALLAVLSYRKTTYKALFVAAMILPLFVPGVVQGFSLLMLFKQIGFGQAFVATAIGHVIWAFLFAFLVILTSMSTVRDDVLLASADLGANEFETFRHVIFPRFGRASSARSSSASCCRSTSSRGRSTSSSGRTPSRRTSSRNCRWSCRRKCSPSPA